MMKYIVAGNFKQAIEFARKKAWGRKEWRYIPSLQETFGLFMPDVWRVGTWNERRDAAALYNALQARGATFHE